MDIGTPRDSILGPLTCTLFENDQPLYIQTGCLFMYADDTTIVISVESLYFDIHIHTRCSKNKRINNTS